MINVTDLPSTPTHSETTLARLWRRRDVWQITLLFVILYIVGSVVAALVSGDNQLLLTITVLAASAAAGCGSILLVNRLRQRHDWTQLGFVGVNRQWLLVGSGLALAFAFGRFALLNWLATTFPALTIGVDLLEQVLLFDTTAGIVISTVATVLVVPLWEEFFFRGFIHNALRNRLGMWAAIVASSLLFGLFHIIPLQMLGAFLLALPLAWAYEKSGSLWLVIYMHALNNLLAVGLVYAVG